MDRERSRLDRSATDSSFRNHFFGDIRPIQSKMDRHVRLENRRVVSPGKIGNFIFEKAARWLRRNKPVGNGCVFHA